MWSNFKTYELATFARPRPRKNHWFDFPEKLQAARSNILALDLPGAGDENWTRPPLTIEGHSDFLREKFLTLKSNAGPWGILGISLGGMIAMDWASRYPDDFTKLVVINASAQDLSPVQQRMTVFSIYCMGKAAVAKDLQHKEYELLKMVSNLKAKDAVTLQNMVDLGAHAKITNENIARQVVAAARFTSPKALTIPTLYLASIKDRMVDVRCSKAIAEKYGAQIKFHPSAGHDLTLDDPDWAVEQIVEFTST